MLPKNIFDSQLNVKLFPQQFLQYEDLQSIVFTEKEEGNRQLEIYNLLSHLLPRALNNDLQNHKI